MKLDENWFTEVCEEAGSAFSLRTRGLLHREQSPFQLIEVYETSGFGRLLVIDGCTMLSDRDNFIYHEMMAHPALFIHPEPRRVAIIGGGDCGTLREVLRHPEVRQATQIDIDERVTRVAEQFFPTLCEANDDPRAELLFSDGIEWMRQAPAGSLDLVIVDSTDPVGPGEVLFSEAFYRACLAALGDGGLLVQQSESPLLHMDILQRMHRDMRVAGFDHSRSLFFPLPLYPSGWWSATLTRKGAAIEGFRRAAVEQLRLPTRYYNAAIHEAAFARPAFFDLGD